jgi:hypothetical protein
MPVRHLTNQMARNATTYTQGGGYQSRLSITVAPHGGFIILDFVKKPFNWGFSSALLGVGNLRAGAAERLEGVLRRLVDLQVPHPAQMTQFDLVVAIVRGSNRDVN